MLVVVLSQDVWPGVRDITWLLGNSWILNQQYLVLHLFPFKELLFKQLTVVLAYSYTR